MSNVGIKGTGAQNYTSNELKTLGGENIGEVLNQITDPGYIDPAKKLRGVGNNALDKDAFMKLMLTQMKNQDPTNPLKSHEMAAQLAQFSSVEQMMNINQTLTEMKNATKTTETFQTLNLIGKVGFGDSSEFVRAKNDKTHELAFDLPEAASELTLEVKDNQGMTIRKVQMRDVKKGPQSWSWNGETDSGGVSQPGDYRFAIEAKGTSGQRIPVKTDFHGLISGVNFTPQGPVLQIGNQSVKMKDVKKITTATQDLSTLPVKSENERSEKLISTEKKIK